MPLFSEEKKDVEESVRTVDCLRGRLLAERLTSRNAKMEAEHLGNKVCVCLCVYESTFPLYLDKVEFIVINFS